MLRWSVARQVALLPASIAGELAGNAWVNVPPPLSASGLSNGSPDNAAPQLPSRTRLLTLAEIVPPI